MQGVWDVTGHTADAMRMVIYYHDMSLKDPGLVPVPAWFFLSPTYVHVYISYIYT
jgi:hypothetical protein